MRIFLFFFLFSSFCFLFLFVLCFQKTRVPRENTTIYFIQENEIFRNPLVSFVLDDDDSGSNSSSDNNSSNTNNSSGT